MIEPTLDAFATARDAGAVMTLTEQLAAAARDGDWEEAARLQALRGPALRALLDAPGRGVNVTEEAAFLRRLIVLESEIARLAESAHASIGAELAALQRGNGARLAYGRLQSPG
jgi:dihydrodipicolinate synthase/N-acetylneuraminate lyase